MIFDIFDVVTAVCLGVGVMGLCAFYGTVEPSTAIWPWIATAASSFLLVARVVTESSK